MSKELGKLAKDRNEEIDFKLSFDNAKAHIRDDGTFRLTWESSEKHSWYSSDGQSGKVSSEWLSRSSNWIKTTGDTLGLTEKYQHGDKLSLDDKDGNKKIIGTMPGKSGNILFLFESEQIKLENGNTCLDGRLLSADFVINYAKELAHAFGEKSVRNHLLLERGFTTDISSLETLSKIMSSDVKYSFWRDIDKLKKYNEELAGGKDVNAVAKSSNSIWEYAEDWGKDVIDDASDSVTGNSSAKFLKSLWDDVINVVDDVADGVNDAKDWIDDQIDAGGDAIITPAEDIIDDAADIVINGIDIILDPTGPMKLSDTIDFELISQRHEEAPFYAEYNSGGSVQVDILFEKGYLGAIDTSTILVTLTPNIDMNASAGLELDPLVLTYNGSIEGPHQSILNPVVGEITLSSRLDYEFIANASVGDGVGAGVAVEASPEAKLSFKADLVNPDAKLYGLEDNFKYTEDLDRLFNNFDPKGELSAKITPVLNITALPVIPDEIPTVGGMGLANVGVDYFNPIVFNYETSEPMILKGNISGSMEPELSIFGQKIGGIPSFNVYSQSFELPFA